jgi:hypothetical protein
MNIIRQQVEDAIHAAHDVPTVTHARTLVEGWVEEHPDDEFIPEAAESLEICAAILRMPPYENPIGEKQVSA